MEQTSPKKESNARRPASGLRAYGRSISAFLENTISASLARIRGYGAAEIVAHARRSKPYIAPSACAIVLNMAILGMILLGLRLPASESPHELHLILSQTQRAEIRQDISIPNVDMPILQMPDIVIAPDAPRPAAAASSTVLAPRPDPDHPNPVFAAAKDSPGAVTPTPLVLRILVLPDGSVADAEIAKTSGQRDVDMDAIAFVKAQWKFLPALLDDKPVRYWTTVLVRLS